MPRPGTRPYECLRRAWHSDRHQPMRGSLIKDLFRIAHEIHSPTTKKNKEWQQKLPILVLKAEEFMYSKANSEAEYMDPKTLWERLTDAIDTIIRRDRSDEAEQLFQPCIEAALNLACIPRRASRSQRNANPRFYVGAYKLGRGDGALQPPSPLTSQSSNFLNPATLNPNISGNDPLPKCDLNTFFPVSDSPGSKLSFPYDSKSSTEEDQPEKLACDLSLRLAPLSVSVHRAFGEDVVRTDSRDGHLNTSLETRKRRAVEMVDDQQVSWQPKLLCTCSAGSARIAGL